MIYAKHTELKNIILVFENDIATYKDRTYKLDTSWTLCTEMEYAIQKNLDLTGRYLEVLVDNPINMTADVGDILLITKKNNCNNITRGNNKDWLFYLSDKYFKLLPKEYKPEITLKNESLSNAPFKIGDLVYLDKYYTHSTETIDYSLIAKIPLDKPLSIKYIGFSPHIYGNIDPEWVVSFDGYDYKHPAVKFKKYTKQWEPSVGDWVVLTKSNINWAPEMDSFVGNCVKITNILDTFSKSIDFKDRAYNWYFIHNHFRKAEEHEIPISDNSYKYQKPTNDNITELTEEHLGSLLSFTCDGRFYDKALFIKENGYYHLLNNCHSNLNAHGDKSLYKYSIGCTFLIVLNSLLKNIKILSDKDVYINHGSNLIEKPNTNDETPLYIPEIKEIPVKVDYSVNVKLIDIKLPDFSVKPEQIELIKVEPYKLNI
jgi:hypothetical protein